MIASDPARRTVRVLLVALVVGCALPAAAPGATTYTVTTSSDAAGDGVCDATCTLREAINLANASAGADTILFSGVSGAIQPMSALPMLNDSVAIDGRVGSNPGIEIDGVNAGDSNGLETDTAGSVTIRGLSIVGFANSAIALDGDTTATVQTCRVGVRLDGSAAGNGSFGVALSDGTKQIGGAAAGEGNVISANGEAGILVSGNAANVRIEGNRIGTNPAGTAASGTQGSGVLLFNATGGVVGGEAEGDANLISGNEDGVEVLNSPSSKIHGNKIGLSADGAAAVPNDAGVLVHNDSAGNEIGGAASGQGNVIAGNSSVGIAAFGAGAKIDGNLISGNADIGVFVAATAMDSSIGDGTAAGRNVIVDNGAGMQIDGARTRVKGNYIGIDADGVTLGSNAAAGVIVQGAADDSEIGGPAAGEGNIISGNNASGVVVRLGATGVRIRGNAIGVDKDGKPARNLSAGIRIFDAANTTIGGSDPADWNTVAFNGSGGISVDLNDPSDPDFTQPTGNEVVGNSIHDNGSLGIDLSAQQVFGRTPNDAGDADSGANDVQNFPELATAYDGGGSTAITGALNSTPNSTFKLRFYTNPADGDEGETFLAEQSVTTDGAGNAAVAYTATPAIALGRTVTATATNAGGSTSELSDPVTVQTPPPPPAPPPAPPGPDPRLGVIGFTATHFRATSSAIRFRLRNTVAFDIDFQITGREGKLRLSRLPAFRAVKTTVPAGTSKTVRLRVPRSQRRAIRRALRTRRRVIRRPSIRVTNLTSRTSQQYKPRLTVRR